MRNSIMRRWDKPGIPHRGWILEGVEDIKADCVGVMDGRPDKYHIVKSVSIAEGVDNILPMLDEYEAVLLNDVPSERKNDILK